MDAEDDRTQIDPRANPWAMLAALPLFSGLPKSIVDQAVAELEWLSVPGGHVLFEAGSPSDAVFFVVSGCLGVYGPGGELVGRVAAGESAYSGPAAASPKPSASAPAIAIERVFIGTLLAIRRVTGRPILTALRR